MYAYSFRDMVKRYGRRKRSGCRGSLNSHIDALIAKGYRIGRVPDGGYRTRPADMKMPKRGGVVRRRRRGGSHRRRRHNKLRSGRF